MMVPLLIVVLGQVKVTLWSFMGSFLVEIVSGNGLGGARD